MKMWEYEEACWAEGHALVCGADEAGAGPLAGPVYAGAVILPRYIELPWLNDSKQVTPKRRDVLFEEIKAAAVAWAVQQGTSAMTSPVLESVTGIQVFVWDSLQTPSTQYFFLTTPLIKTDLLRLDSM